MARRTILVGLTIFLLTAAFTAPAYCDGPAKKLGRGLSNTITFPFEMYYRFVEVNDSDGLIAALTWGVLKGIGRSVVRLAVGVYEVATFPFPVPEDYMPLLTDPEFAFENLENSFPATR